MLAAGYRLGAIPRGAVERTTGWHVRALLVARLERQGVGQAQMAGFFRELAKLMTDLPDATLPAVNARLHYLGWGDVTMDYHSLQRLGPVWRSAKYGALTLSCVTFWWR